jgi:hypothetical protein
MKYLVRSVHQLTTAETQQYINLFNKIFDKILTQDEFYYKFSKQFGNNSYFALMVDDNNGIVGSVGAIEVQYTWQGQQFTFGLTVDGMIEMRHRKDFLALKRLHDLLTTKISKEGFAFIFTKPNDNSYLYLKKMLNLEDLGVLNVYAFPLRLFHTGSRRLRWLDLLWLGALGVISPRRSFRDVSLQEIEEMTQPILPVSQTHAHRVRDADFLRRRYGSRIYRYVALDDRFVIYRNVKFGVWHACFIMEPAAFTIMEWIAFVRYLASRHSYIDVVLYLDGGRPHLLPFIRVPRWMLPDKLNIVGKILNPSSIPADVAFSMRLADFEVV